MNNCLKIGWAEVDITPNEKIGLAGQFYERISEEVESPITVTALAVEKGDEQLIICSCDLASTSKRLLDAVRANVADKLPFSTDKIIINAVHDHTSYDYSIKIDPIAKNLTVGGLQVLRELLPDDMEYVPLTASQDKMSPEKASELLIEKISQAIISAWETRKDAYYANAFGRAAVGMCRRVTYDDGSAKMWGDTNLANFEALEGGNDSGIELIYTFDNEKRLTGIVANIACPAQIVEHRSFISSDYWGKVKEYLRKRFGESIMVLGLCSAAGDQCPRDMVRWVNPETPINDPNINRDDYIERRADPSMFDISGLKVVGRRIANEIIAVFEETELELKNDGILIHNTDNITIPLRRVTIEEHDSAVEKINDFIDKNRGKSVSFKDTAALHIYAGTIARYRLQQKLNSFSVEVHTIRWGDIAIATNPFELFLDYGNKIRARSKAKQTFLIQLACGSFGYLPTEKAEKGSHYSAYVSSGRTGHIGGDILVRESLEAINKLF